MTAAGWILHAAAVIVIALGAANMGASKAAGDRLQRQDIGLVVVGLILGVIAAALKA